jgi:hypothetical protein
MMAFIATGVYLFHALMDVLLISPMLQVHVVIQEWETGVRQSKSFTAISITATYKKHISILEAFENRKPLSYHRTMSSLFVSALYGPVHLQTVLGLPLHHRDNAGGEDSELEDAIGEIDFNGMEE